uniref:Secreted protein n=1 Tax=Physcomitrium patens TaxID=3218 RepID=A0A2K1IK91_PHYPA|nr:hypothetical protein PHYPA_028385 [Physcomitrium patens]
MVMWWLTFGCGGACSTITAIVCCCDPVSCGATLFVPATERRHGAEILRPHQRPFAWAINSRASQDSQVHTLATQDIRSSTECDGDDSTFLLFADHDPCHNN